MLGELKVVVVEGDHRLDGGGPIDVLANRYLSHLAIWKFSPGTVRGYAFDLLNFSRSLAERGLPLGNVTASDLFDWLEWQSRRTPTGKVTRLDAAPAPAPATINRRFVAVRGLFDHAAIVGVIGVSPVPGARRATGWRASKRGLLAHVAPGHARGGAVWSASQGDCLRRSTRPTGLFWLL